MNILNRIAKSYSTRARARRAALFRERFSITSSTRILDLGSETGTAINAVLQGTAASPSNIYIADINPKQVNEGARRFGYQPVVIDESGRCIQALNSVAARWKASDLSRRRSAGWAAVFRADAVPAFSARESQLAAGLAWLPRRRSLGFTKSPMAIRRG